MTPSQETPAVSKKEYHTPNLTEYGDVRTLTLSAGMNGAMDGGQVINFMNSRV